MNLVLNILVLIFEILYYSLFMKYARRDGNILKYILAFIINTLVIMIADANNLPTYFIFVLTSLLLMKYLVKVKISLFDMLIIVIMLFLKVVIETPIYLLLIGVSNKYIVAIIANIIKIISIRLFSNKITKFIQKLKIKWDNNDFYIRYIFSILIFTYCIITAILLIFY